MLLLQLFSVFCVVFCQAIVFDRQNFFANNILPDRERYDTEYESDYGTVESIENEPQLLKCNEKLLARLVTFEGLNNLLKEYSAWEKTSPMEVIHKLASLHGVLDINRAVRPSYTFTQRRRSGLNAQKNGFDMPPKNPSDFITQMSMKSLMESTLMPENGLPYALLVLIKPEEKLIATRWVALQTRTALWEFLKLVSGVKESIEGEIQKPPLRFKPYTFSKSCLAIRNLGPLEATRERPLVIRIFTSKAQKRWESMCLPKRDLLLHSGDVVIISPHTINSKFELKHDFDM